MAEPFRPPRPRRASELTRAVSWLANLRVAQHRGERYHSAMRTPLPLIVLFCTGVGIVAAQSGDTTLAVIPRPVHMTRGGSPFVLTAGTALRSPPPAPRLPPPRPPPPAPPPPDPAPSA